MKRILRWLMVVLGLGLLLALVALLGRDVFLKGLAQKRIEQRTGFRVEIGSLKTGLRVPSLRLRDLRVYNGPDFGGSLLLEIPECYIELDSYQMEEKFHLRELRLNLTQLNVIRDKSGRFNLERLPHPFQAEASPAATPGTQRPAAPARFAGIDRVRLTIGKINFTDWQKPSRSRVIEVGIKDEWITSIRTEEDLQAWIGSRLFRLIVQELSKTDGKGRGGRLEIRMDPSPESSATNASPATPSP